MADRPANRTFKKKDVLKATNISNQTFQHWFDRRVISLSPEDIPGDGPGNPRRFTEPTIIKLAIAHKISLLGIPANMAVTMASNFTDLPQHGRQHGQLFPIGLTAIVATPDGKSAVMNIMPEEDVTAFLKDATLIVNINEIISNIKFPIGVLN